MRVTRQGDDATWAGCAHARPTNSEPALLTLVSRRVVHRDACIRISIPGEVRRATFAAAIIHVGCGAAVANLIAWLRLIGTGPSASPAPDLLAPVGAAGADAAAALRRPVDRQRSAANREDVGRS